MPRGRQRTAPDAPLAAFVSRIAKAKGITVQGELYELLGISATTFQNWRDGTVPHTPQVTKIKTALRLSREEKAELDEVLTEQIAYEPTSAEAAMTTPPEVSTTTVVRDDPYTFRESAIELLTGRVSPKVIDALRKIGNAEGDRPIGWWIDRAFEFEAEEHRVVSRPPTPATGTAFDLGPNTAAIEAKTKRGKR